MKNITSLKLDGNNFSLNDEEFNEINNISKEVEAKDIILFWQFTINAIEELDIVANPNLFVEMFLVRLMYLKSFKKENFTDQFINKDPLNNITSEKKISLASKTIDQIKNISQKDKKDPKLKSQDITKELLINSFEDLINLCLKKKEIKLKYELESNINLVSFSQGKIEISFNENLDKNFIKELSNKLYEWTNQRWIILLSKKEGQISKKKEIQINKDKIFDNFKENEIYKKILEVLPDAELIDVKINKKQKDE